MNLTAILVSMLLLLGNGFFVGAEFALIAARRTQLEPLAEAGSRRAQLALAAMGQIPLMVAGAQLGITVCSLGLGALAEPAIADALIGPFEALSIPHNALHPAAFTVALALVVFLHTVVGEMVPKNISLAGPDKTVQWLGPPMWWFCLATKPLLVAMKWLSRTILRLWGIHAADEVKTIYTADELAALATESRTEGLLDATDHQRIFGALTLATRQAGSMVRPWPQVQTVFDDITPTELEILAARTHRSRYPVLRRDGVILGFVHVKEMLTLPESAHNDPIPREAIRPLVAVAPTTTLADLLVRMRRERSHLVLVRRGDNPLGVVAMEDVLNSVVGTRPA
ncbi:MAG: HlyC/CorC family transporter [Corynebacteriales bacterium]|nr:HlyC/CorC family transporter [Mycobacteriales bacterium]